MATDNGETILQEILNNELDDALSAKTARSFEPSLFMEDNDAPAPEPKKDKENHCQWALGGNGQYIPVGMTTPKLPPGIYEPFATPGSWGLELMKIASDGIYTLPDMATEAVLKEVNSFWSNEARYRKHNLLYKRGILLWGPPGGGKTVTIKLLMNELMKRDGIVIVAQRIDLSIMCLKAVRRIEPTRNLIVVLEDIDEIIQHNGESVVLSMLDGENNVDNILHLASTNYPEKLGARIINRPSRFDNRVYVGMPGDDARKMYLTLSTKAGLTESDLAKWVVDTKDMSIAHLRELVAAVYCLDQPYEGVLERLKNMATPPKSEDGFKAKNLGFSSSSSEARRAN